MYKKQLLQLGLNEKEADIYQLILDTGRVSVAQILKKTPYKRGDIYNILYSLQKKELISESEEKGKKIFILENPDKLVLLIKKQKEEAETNQGILNHILPDLKIYYTTVFDKPGVKYFEGLEGFRQMHADIAKTGGNVRIFTTPYDYRSSHEGMMDIINEFILKQQKANILTRVFVIKQKWYTQAFIQEQSEKNIEMRILENQLLDLPSQITIYGDKIAMVSVKDEIVTTVIENQNIAESFEKIFDLLWQLTENEHERILASLPKE